jgi:DNA-directed RNA polymerase specialized sigma subunit
MKKASSLVEIPNIDTKPKAKDLEKLFKNITDIPQRNKVIYQAYQQGYSQYMIAKVLGMAQSTVNGIVKRMSR